jgi:hypothetical protein
MLVQLLSEDHALHTIPGHSSDVTSTQLGLGSAGQKVGQLLYT